MSKPKKSKPKVNAKLQGFEVKIDSLGEIRSSFEIDKINKFLDEEVEDKKLLNRKDLKETYEKKKDKDSK